MLILSYLTKKIPRLWKNNKGINSLQSFKEKADKQEMLFENTQLL